MGVLYLSPLSLPDTRHGTRYHGYPFPDATTPRAHTGVHHLSVIPVNFRKVQWLCAVENRKEIVQNERV